jgi:uncharacterized caspase-like protein
MRTLRSIGIAIAVCLGLTATGAAEDRSGRVALVVGNGAYTGAAKLPNPANDADDVGTVLEALGFDVIKVKDAARRDFVAAIDRFLTRAATAEAALLYYAGHGIQLDGENFLLPVDAAPESAVQLRSDAFGLQSIIAELEQVSEVNLVFLDACRDNPLAARLSTVIMTRSGGRPLGRGLTLMRQASNTMIAFAAAPGEVALDGGGRNSPFTKAFVKNVAASREEVSTLFKAIIRDVVAETGGAQQPQLVSSMSANFFFNSTVTIQEAPVDPAQAAYEAAAALNTAEAYRIVVQGYPQSVYARLATAAIAKLEPKVAIVQPTSPVVPAPPPVIRLTPEDAEAALGLDVEARRAVQIALAGAGRNPGGSDGALGPRSREAISDYQVEMGMEATGFISKDLLASLGVPYKAPAVPPMGADARRVSLAELGEDADPRLRKVVETLAGKEIRVGEQNGNLYVAVLAWSVSWDAAKALAERAGGHLVTITSRAENDFVLKLFESDDRFTNPHDQNRFLDGPWIGLYQDPAGREPAGGWRWVTDEKVTFTGWRVKPGNAPDNFNGNEHAGRFWGVVVPGRPNRANVWDDGAAENQSRGFIMEVESVQDVAGSP